MEQSSDKPADSKPLLSVSDMSVGFAHRSRETTITHGVTFDIAAGERLGVVGESGCGKSVTGLGIMGLLPRATARIRGRVNFDGQDLGTLSARTMRHIRGKEISMIFQEPMSALDPVFTVGQQLIETLRSHEKISKVEARERSIEALAEVGIPSPELRIDEYPHQFSGGMRQRVMIAMALICRPKLIIADEPTTALDVTVQAQITDLLAQLSDDTGTALMFITHDLGVVAEVCSRVMVMYAGEVVEIAPTDELLYRPGHPYSSGLLRSLPGLTSAGGRLPYISGRVPPPDQMPAGCRFRPRCPYVTEQCAEPQQLDDFGPQRLVRCWQRNELELPGAVDEPAMQE